MQFECIPTAYYGWTRPSKVNSGYLLAGVQVLVYWSPFTIPKYLETYLYRQGYLPSRYMDVLAVILSIYRRFFARSSATPVCPNTLTPRYAESRWTGYPAEPETSVANSNFSRNFICWTGKGGVPIRMRFWKSFTHVSIESCPAEPDTEVAFSQSRLK